MSEDKATPDQHVKQVFDSEHVSGRAGTLLVATHFDKSTLGLHDIDKVDTNAVASLKTTPDGQTVLIPQPTNDPEQPLNWSWGRKHKVLLLLVYCTLMTDLTSAWEIPLVIPQAEYWHITPSNAGRNLSGNIFMLAVGGVLAVPLTRWVGRLPVIFWSMFFGFCMTIFATTAPTWISFIVARCLQGLFITTPQVVGLSMIHDMFFFHERARKIGIWAATFIFSPFAGPFLSGIMVNFTNWRKSMWLNTGLVGLGLGLVSLFGEETVYRPTEAQGRKSGLVGQTMQLTGVNGYRSYTGGVESVVRDMAVMLTRPHFVGLCVFYMLTFMWSIGLNATLTLFVGPPPPAGYGYSDLKVALLYISPMLASMIGELFGHWFNDFIANRSIRRSGGAYEAEVRLWMLWISLPFLIAGLVFFGFALKDRLSWVSLCFAWGFYQFGMVTATVAITAYALDIFPDHSVEAAAILNAFRGMGGFIVNYFQVEWAHSFGPQNSFGVEAGIVGGAVVVAVLVQIFGRRWRTQFPAPTR